ncbi:MAG: DUF2797 domain-containing protein [Flavobacteriales bacterium]|nr:DUF2797 domain-containing protein [Flavobacteriales bacterium]
MYIGTLNKMQTQLTDSVTYSLPIGEELIGLNKCIGNEISFKFTNRIVCVECGKDTIKSFNQGFCYSCFKKSPAAADWIIHPELSKAHLGIEDRNLDYEKEVQLKPHIVYLSKTSGIKVGMTRESQVPTRWIDQGAVEAIPIARTSNRYLAGMIEVDLKNHFADKTNWKQMLMNFCGNEDILQEKEKIKTFLPKEYHPYLLPENNITKINYPVLKYPTSIVSFSFDKNPEYSGKLIGIKGQYLYFENGIVLNIRTFTGYEVELCI